MSTSVANDVEEVTAMNITQTESAPATELSREPQRGGEIINSNRTLRLVHPATAVPAEETTVLAERFMEQRYRYVQKEGWLPERTDDVDGYDQGYDGLRTWYILRSDEKDVSKLVAGARLTPVTNVEQSLTWHMMDCDQEAQKTAQQHKSFRSAIEAVAAGKLSLYDFTRLIPDEEFDNTEGLSTRMRMRNLLVKRNAIFDIMGACLAASVADKGDVAWVYLTTPEFVEFLTVNGIEYTGLAQMQDTASGKKDTLVITYPKHAMHTLKTLNPGNYERILAAAESLGFRQDLLQEAA